MNKKLRITITIILALLILIGTVLFFKERAKKQVIAKFQTAITKNLADAQFSYDEINTIGFFKPKSILCKNCTISFKSGNVTSEIVNISIVNNNEFDLEFNNIIFTFVEAQSQSPKQSQFSYKIIAKEKLLIYIKDYNKKSDYKITLPQNILFNNLYNTNVISFNKKNPIIKINHTDNQLKELSYKDHGSKIYDEQNILISSHEDTLFNIKKLANQEAWNITFSSKGQQINSKTLDNNNFINKIFDIKLNANYKDLSKEKNDFYKQLVISNLAILFPKVTINLNADIVQDSQNLIPYGKANLSITNYKFAIDTLYNNMSSETTHNNMPEFFVNLQNNSEDYKLKTIAFLEKLNNNDNNDLTLQIVRQVGDLPYINNLSINEISEIFNQIYNSINPEEGVY